MVNSIKHLDYLGSTSFEKHYNAQKSNPNIQIENIEVEQIGGICCSSNNKQSSFYFDSNDSNSVDYFKDLLGLPHHEVVKIMKSLFSGGPYTRIDIYDRLVDNDLLKVDSVLLEKAFDEILSDNIYGKTAEDAKNGTLNGRLLREYWVDGVLKFEYHQESGFYRILQKDENGEWTYMGWTDEDTMHRYKEAIIPEPVPKPEPVPVEPIDIEKFDFEEYFAGGSVPLFEGSTNERKVVFFKDGTKAPVPGPNDPQCWYGNSYTQTYYIYQNGQEVYFDVEKLEGAYLVRESDLNKINSSGNQTP